MPNIKSAKKRVKVSTTKALRNKAYNSALKTTVKKATTAIDTGAADSRGCTSCVKNIDGLLKEFLQNTAQKKVHYSINARFNKYKMFVKQSLVCVSVVFVKIGHEHLFLTNYL
ncbi:MAG: 30S ribosomal protein S20 [Blautia producta]